ncbi:MAG TPA: response regulator, partial [Aggregatilineales bacterium]|nr:response regulator [Aggregatilineales bacterium]
MTGERILLVEDAEDTRNFLAESVLIPEGFEVMAAANSTEAISVLQNWQPHLIIADYLMPKMTGLELLEYLKQNGSELPFILITAEGSEALAVRAMRLGVRDYLIKPFNIDDFLNAIQRVLATPQAAVPVVSMSQRLEQLLQNSNAGILSTDLDNHILYLNQTFQDMFELTKSAVGRNLNDLISNPELLEVFDESGQPYLTREIDLNGEHTLSAIFSQMPGVGKLAVMQDITEYKKLDRTRTEFITAISHDLRSPLTTIMGYVELLERTGPLNEVQKKFTDHIIFSVRS